jgi:hypothetical protein
MARRRFRVPAVVASDGSGTFYTPYFSGAIESIQYVKTDYADTVDFTITSDATGQTLWTEANVTVAKTCMPRGATHSNAGVAATYDGTRAIFDRIVLASDRVKIVIASGGTSTTGLFYVTTSD